MRKATLFGLFFLFLLGGCSSDSDGGPTVNTTQLSSTQAIQFYADLVAGLAQALGQVQDCGDFFQTLAALTQSIPCPDGGTQRDTYFDATCSENPAFSAQANLSWLFEECILPGALVNGEILGTFYWDGTELSSDLTAKGFLFNGLPQSFSNLNILISGADAPQCEGQILITDDFCPVTPDCQFCPL